jgi:thiol:disulfide interchange protein DsbA
MKFKILIATFAGLAFFVLFGNSCFAEFTEGRDYLVLERPIPNAQNTLVKVFSYDCPACYKYDKNIMPVIVRSLPAGLTYRPFHLKTRAKYGVQASVLFAVLLVKDQESGLNDRELYSEHSLLKKALDAYYDAYHEKRERWDSGLDSFLTTGLETVGMSKEEFYTAIKSPKVKALLAEWDASYEIAKIRGIPSFVVNGKYLINNKSLKSFDSMLAIITELWKK